MADLRKREAADPRTNEQRYYDALKSIARKYQKPKQLRQTAESVGLTYEEHLEMAYENVQGIADAAIRGRRRPRGIAR